MKYLIYARVSPKGSSWDGTETSIQMQIDYCREYIKFHGGEVFAVITDEFYSGKDTARPGFSQIMEQLRAGNAGWDTLIVYKLSRMSRNLRDGAEIFATLFEQGKGFISATEHLDFSTPSGRAMLGVMQVFNQFEREQTAENIRNKMVSIAARGMWPTGNPPFGYKRGARKDNKLYIDPRKAQIVKDIFEMYATEKYNTVDILNKYRGTIGKSSLFTMLRNRTYLGKIIYAGHEFEGQHDAIVPESLFNIVQSLIPENPKSSRPKAQKYSYLLTGLLKCHCGCSMSPASAKGGRYHYYVCGDIACKTRVKAEKIEDAVLDQLEKYRSDDALLDRMERKLIKAKEEFLSHARPEMEEAISARREATLERDKIYKVILSMNALNDAGFLNDKLNYLTKEINRLTAKIEMLGEQTKDTSVYDDIQQELYVMRNTAKLLTEARTHNDRIGLRKIILTHIARIENIGENHYRIEPSASSSKCKEWWSMANLAELLRVRVA